MKKILLVLWLVVLCAGYLFAQKPNINYQVPQTLYKDKPITPISPVSTGGAVPAKLYPYVNEAINTTVYFRHFVKLSSGNIYGIGGNNVKLLKPNGTVSAFVGSDSESGYTDGAGTSARFNELHDIAADADGNLYVTEDNSRDGQNGRVRKITPAGQVSTYAQGLRNPQGIAIDGNGILYVAEHAGKITKIAKDGTKTLLAGKYGQGAQNGKGAAASFNMPEGIAIDKAGNVFVADRGNELIRKITPAGDVSTFSGGGGFASTDGPATQAGFEYAASIQVDSKGCIYVGQENGIIRKVSPEGYATTLRAPFYDADNNTVFYKSISDAFIVDSDDNLLAIAGNLYSAGGFYKVQTTGYSVNPALPAGLKLGVDGTITGTPTETVYKQRYFITASNAAGMSTAAFDLEVSTSADAPVITSFTPTKGYIATDITISGKFFYDLKEVTIGGVKAQYAYAETSNKIVASVAEGSKSGDIVVKTAYGTATAPGFQFIPEPTITSVSPMTGHIGSVITIKGTDLSAVEYISVGDIGNPDFKIKSDTEIELKLSESNSGAIYLSAPNGSASYPGFTFIKPPSISSVSPERGSGGSTVTINGNNFNNATQVKFGSVAASSFKVLSNTQMSAVVAPGSGNGLTITTPAGTGSFSGFTYVLPPEVNQIYPLKGGANTQVYVYGTRLQGARVEVGGYPATISFSSDYQIYFYPSSKSTSGEVKIITAGGEVILNNFVLVPPPNPTAFSPGTGASGDKITITGTNLDETDAVSVGGFYASFRIVSPTQLEVILGDGASGTINVYSEGGVGSLEGFVHKGPSITSFTPASAGVGKTVVITGANFTNVQQVFFGDVPATSFTVNSATKITAVVGQGKTGNVSVATSAGRAYLSGFTHPGPTISMFTPNFTGKLRNYDITIYGNNFTGATSVTFGGKPAETFRVESAFIIIAKAAPGSTGDVVVTTPDGTDKSPGFIWVDAPEITGFTPTSQYSGGMVTITGKNFVGVTGVKFGGVSSYYYSTSSPTTITAAVSDAKNDTIEVTTVGGVAIIKGFKYMAPTITSVEPLVAVKGETVTITGSNLSGVQSVRFGYSQAASFTIVNDKKITAVVGDASSGEIYLQGTSGTVSYPGFVFLGLPSVYNVSPDAGGLGTLITLRGSNLLTTSEVKVGGTLATIVSVENDRVTVKVGSGATGKVTLKTKAGTTEAGNFTWYAAPVITSASPMTANAQTKVTITGKNFTGITELKFGGQYVSFEIISSTQIIVTPTYAASGNITITTYGGEASLPGFKFIPAPELTSFTVAGEGANATVTINGKNFTDVSKVSFGGVPAKSFTVVSAQVITAKPGTGATGSIEVQASGGTGTIRGFLYTSPPSISSFSPGFGAIGSTLTILGDNFNTVANKNVVYIGPLKATIKSASKTKLEVIVPAGGNNQITVTNTETRLSATTNNLFLVTNTAGSTTFSNKYLFKKDAIPYVTAIHDFDEDGKPDLLIAKGDSLYILRYGADPVLSKSSFTEKVVLVTERDYGAVTVADVDGDGKKDIMATMMPSMFYLHNTTQNGKISFEARVMEELEARGDRLILRDVNGDGKLDLIQGDGPVYQANISTGSNITFAESVFVPNEGSSAGIINYALRDLDGDGKDDHIIGDSYNSISIHQNKTVPGSIAAEDFPKRIGFGGTYPDQLTTADLDGDGKPEILVHDWDQTNVYIYRNKSTVGTLNGSSFAAAQSFTGYTAREIAGFADMDADGKLDILVKPNYGLSYTRNRSTPGNLSLAAPTALIDSSRWVSVVDIDGDGRLDVFSLNANMDQITIYHNGPVVTPEITKASLLAASKGVKVILTGKHFDGTTVVKFGGVAAQSFTVTSTETIEAFVGDGATGIITIETPNGKASLAGFTYAHAPVITKAKAAADGSGKLTITGKNFSKTETVSIAGIEAGTFTVQSDSVIVATFSGVKGELKVTTNGGTGTLPQVTVAANLVISFPALNARTYGDSDFVTGAASNNTVLPITYALDNNNVARIINGKLHIIGAGEVKITASQTGDELNYTAADITRTLKVNKKQLTVKAVDKSRTYGTPNAAFTVEYDGFVNGEDETALNTVPFATTTANQQSAAGEYDITVSGGVANNYTFVYIGAKLTITPATTNFRVAASSVTCKGENNGAITVEATTEANYVASLTGKFGNKNYNFTGTLNINALAPGTYSLCITSGTLGNYSQCFDLVITEPKDLTLYTAVNKKDGTIELKMSGGELYQITLNGKTYQTRNNTIILPADATNNTLSVSTDKACQGVIERIINMTDEVLPYPNPFADKLSLNLGDKVIETIVVQIFKLADGRLKLSKEFKQQAGVITLDVAGLDTGIYTLHLYINNKKSVYKIIKQ